MKIYMTLWFAFFCGFGGFAKMPKTDKLAKEAIIKFEVKNHKTNKLVLINNLDFLNWIPDTLNIINGKCEKRIRLSNPIYIDVRNNDGIYGWIYLAPGYHSKVVIDCSKNTKIGMFFEASGDGAIANNYREAIKGIMPPSSLNKLPNGLLLTEQQYLESLDKYCYKRDSTYLHFVDLASKTNNKDKYLKIFFEAEKADNQFMKGYRLLNFISNRRYKKEQAEQFFSKYVAPLGLVNKQINLYALSSIWFFRTYYVDHVIMLKRQSADSLVVRKAGHYATVLDYMSKNYTGLTKSYCISNILDFLAQGVRSYPSYLPPIDSLIRVYEPNIPVETRKMIWDKYKREKAAIDNLYAEGRTIADFKIVDGNGQEMALKNKLTEVTVLDLWASWCGNCIQVFPYGDTLEQKYSHDKRVTFLRVSIDDKKELWEKSVKRLKLDTAHTFWIAGGMKSVFAKKFDLQYLPRWIVLDKEGKVLKLYAPHIADTDKFTSMINKHLH